MARVRAAIGCLFAVVATAGCSLNPQVEPPGATGAENGSDGGLPIFSGGGMGGAAGSANYGTGGRASSGGGRGTGGAVSQGGSSGAPGSNDGGVLPDGAIIGEAGVDAGPDGAPRSDAGTDGAPRSDAGPTKDARTD